ncbi:hypothetical protein HYPSUDRAFT_53920 [Hypholoma sublateritium FD-334 SS-4]|uniref:Uncharacterized protein n=1 Tax=Hypholoma sublateritium (strain FD-334 SS-4) TaxID=945553 RepID=A0A0D2L9S9_HYPSF|nr:hypothetical protein HYPSUDRAFT_53920 [Hypholoma sublateritium FD-334 SS-4]
MRVDRDRRVPSDHRDGVHVPPSPGRYCKYPADRARVRGISPRHRARRTDDQRAGGLHSTSTAAIHGRLSHCAVRWLARPCARRRAGSPALAAISNNISAAHLPPRRDLGPLPVGKPRSVGDGTAGDWLRTSAVEHLNHRAMGDQRQRYTYIHKYIRRPMTMIINHAGLGALVHTPNNIERQLAPVRPRAIDDRASRWGRGVWVYWVLRLVLVLGGWVGAGGRARPCVLLRGDQRARGGVAERIGGAAVGGPRRCLLRVDSHLSVDWSGGKMRSGNIYYVRTQAASDTAGMGHCCEVVENMRSSWLGPFDYDVLMTTEGGQGDSLLCQTITQLNVMLAPACLSMRASLTVQRQGTSLPAPSSGREGERKCAMLMEVVMKVEARVARAACTGPARRKRKTGVKGWARRMITSGYLSILSKSVFMRRIVRPGGGWVLYVPNEHAGHAGRYAGQKDASRRAGPTLSAFAQIRVTAREYARGAYREGGVASSGEVFPAYPNVSISIHHNPKNKKAPEQRRRRCGHSGAVALFAWLRWAGGGRGGWAGGGRGEGDADVDEGARDGCGAVGGGIGVVRRVVRGRVAEVRELKGERACGEEAAWIGVRGCASCVAGEGGRERCAWSRLRVDEGLEKRVLGSSAAGASTLKGCALSSLLACSEVGGGRRVENAVFSRR